MVTAVPPLRVPTTHVEDPGVQLFLLTDSSSLFPKDLENTCPLPATSSFSFASLLNYRNIWKNLLILGFTK